MKLVEKDEKHPWVERVEDLQKQLEGIKLQIKTLEKNSKNKQVLEIDVKVNADYFDLQRLKMLDRVLSTKCITKKNSGN